MSARHFSKIFTFDCTSHCNLVMISTMTVRWISFLLVFAFAGNTYSVDQQRDEEYAIEMSRVGFSRDEMAAPELYDLWKLSALLHKLLSYRKETGNRGLDAQIRKTAHNFLKVEENFFRVGLGEWIGKIHNLLPDDVANELHIQIEYELGISKEESTAMQDDAYEVITGRIATEKANKPTLKLVVNNNTCPYLFLR